jgi:hypothetical protein
MSSPPNIFLEIQKKFPSTLERGVYIATRALTVEKRGDGVFVSRRIAGARVRLVRVKFAAIPGATFGGRPILSGFARVGPLFC